MNGLFITGTDTGVGKTFVSAALITAFANSGVRVAGLKPIASGFELIDGKMSNEDVDALIRAGNVELPPERINRYSFEPAIAPHIAAQQINQQIDIHAIKADVDYAVRCADMVVVEGVGGWHVPLALSGPGQQYDIESLAVLLNIPVVLVVGLRLGCLNHAILSARAIVSSGLPLIGWVANHVDADYAFAKENLQSLESLLPAPKLCEIPFSFKNNGLAVKVVQESDFIAGQCKVLKNS